MVRYLTGTFHVEMLIAQLQVGHFVGLSSICAWYFPFDRGMNFDPD
jgi:hypothetical protein